MMQSMHIHGTLFQALDRNGNSNLPPEDSGWKDTVLVFSGEIVRILIRFDAYGGLFLMHCHNLEHEDTGMMLNFEVENPPAVRLGIRRYNGRVSISYPSSAADYVLEKSEDLANPTSWKALSSSPTVSVRY